MDFDSLAAEMLSRPLAYLVIQVLAKLAPALDQRLQLGRALTYHHRAHNQHASAPRRATAVPQPIR